MLCRVAHDPFGQTSGSEGEVIDAALRDQSDIVVRMIEERLTSEISAGNSARGIQIEARGGISHPFVLSVSLSPSDL